MFDQMDRVVGFLPGEGPEGLLAEDRLAFEVTCRLLADGWVDDDRHLLPSGFDDLAPGLHLAAVVSTIDSSRLNGHDAALAGRHRHLLQSPGL